MKELKMTYLGKDPKQRDCFQVEDGDILVDMSNNYIPTDGAVSDLWIKWNNTEWYKSEPYCPVDNQVRFVARPYSCGLGMESIVEYGVDEHYRHYVYRRDTFGVEYFPTLEHAEQKARAVYKEITAKEDFKRKEFNQSIAMD